MSNPRNAAIVLMSLPPDEAVQLLSKLKPRQAEAVSQEIAKLGQFSGDEQEAALTSFAESNPSALGGCSGDMDAARNLLERAFGRNASSAMENLRQTVEARPFGFLEAVDPQDLLPFIKDEHPQTIALILTHLSASHVARIVAGLPSEQQLQVVRRIAHMGRTSPEIRRQVEQELEKRLSVLVSRSCGRAGGVPTVAEIPHVSQHATKRELLENLSRELPNLVEEIRQLLSAFEDLAKLKGEDIQ